MKLPSVCYRVLRAVTGADRHDIHSENGKGRNSSEIPSLYLARASPHGFKKVIHDVDLRLLLVDIMPSPETVTGGYDPLVL